MDKTDLELWQDVSNDIDGAWKTLINRYQALVYAVVTRAGLSAADAADCFQQTWVLPSEFTIPGRVEHFMPSAAAIAAAVSECLLLKDSTWIAVSVLRSLRRTFL